MKYLKILLLLIFPLNVFANVKDINCNDITLKINEKFKNDNEALAEDVYVVNNYGFFLSQTFDFTKKDFIIKRKNGYPIISTFIDLQTYDQKKIKSGDLLLTINNEDTRNIKDKKLYDLFFSTNNKIEKVAIKFLNIKEKKKITLTLNKKEYFYFKSIPEFYISSINEINTVKGNFDIYYKFTKKFFLPQIGEIISKYKYFDLSDCPLDVNRAEFIRSFYDPYQFLNISKFSDDELRVSYSLGLEKIEENDEKTKPSALFYIDQEGVAKFKNNFDFKKFPFDKQELKISIMEMSGLYPDISQQLELSENIFYSFKKYMNNNNLKEWRIKKFDINLKTANLAGYDLPSAQLDITLNIQRNFLYYIIKIILPIFLILSLAWYVFWINPKELESRITTSIVCFLALVAYNFVIDNDVPKLGYLTYMDWIIMISYIFCALPTAISISLYRHVQSKKYNIIEINSYIRLIGPILYFTLLIGVGLVILF